MSSSSKRTSTGSFLNSASTTRQFTIKKDPNDYYKLKPEYKEFAFKPSDKLEINDKISNFWKEIDANKLLPPANSFIKPDEIEECSRKSDFESMEGEEDSANNILSDQKWTQTLCLLQKKGLDKVATAAKAKACFFCDDKGFAPKFSDEDCTDFIRDYGRD